MQHNGTLRKRKRRNISKVKGLSWMVLSNKYGEDDFNYDTLQSFRSHTESSIQKCQLLNSKRALELSKDPSFHIIEIDEVLGRLPIDLAGSNVKCGNSLGDKQLQNESVSVSLKCCTSTRDRCYFLDSSTIARLKQIIILAMCSGTVPWIFNSKTHTIDRWSPRFERLWRIQWYFVTLQTVCLTIFQFYSLISRLESLQETGNREMFMNFVSAYWYLCAVYFSINLHFYEDKIRQYINTLFRFNREFVEKYVISLDGYQDGGRIVINLSIPSNTCQVFASVALFLVIPYQPWYIFSYLYPKPWYWLIPGAIHEFVLVGQVITNYILYQWIMVSHSNSLEFWLREMHNQHETGYTRAYLREYNEGIKCYRKLQILCSCFNECMSPLSIPLLKTHILTGLVPCGYVVIRSMNEKFIDEFPGILTYPICVIDCASAGFGILSLAAEVFDLAAGFLDSWSRTRRKEFRRVLMSCPVLKIWVGRYYFITVATTITFFKVTTDFIINAIIAFP